MTNIKLKSLKLVNFKGFENYSIEFNAEETKISGKNESGKTTLLDAFLWLMFGKDSSDRKDFSIKTLDANGQAIPHLDHEAEGVLIIDGYPTTLKRVFKEKWQKKRGKEEAEMTGHETLYYVDEVPVKQNEYQAKINAIFTESKFKMLTNPMYFTSLNWKESRGILIEMSEFKEDQIEKPDDMLELMERIGDRSLTDHGKIMAERIKNINKDLKEYPARIDEAARKLTEEPNYMEIEKQRNTVHGKKLDLEMKKNEPMEEYKRQVEMVMKHNSGLTDLKSRLIKIEGELEIEYSQIKSKSISDSHKYTNLVEDLKATIGIKESTVSSSELKIEELTKEKDELLKKWHEIDSETVNVNEDLLRCPTCKRVYDEEVQDKNKSELEAQAAESRATRKTRINEEGKRLADRIKAIQEQNELQKSSLKENKAELTNLEANPVNIEILEFNPKSNAEYLRLSEEIANFQEVPMPSQPDLREIDKQIEWLQNEISTLNAELAKKEVFDAARERVRELKDEMKAKGIELAKCEKDQRIIRDFEDMKLRVVEDRVNSMFTLVKFRLFNKLINGEIEETCVALGDGVPFPDMNRAKQINAGIDIINSLSKFYSVSAPCWIDNAEAVNKIHPSESQMIQLIVSNDETLKIQ